MDLEEALAFLAEKKLWHFLIFITIAAFDIPFAFNLMSPSFLAGEPKSYRCLGNKAFGYITENSSYDFDIASDQCSFNVSLYNESISRSEACDYFEHSKEPFGKTVITEFNLVCNKKTYGRIATAVFYLGVLCGSFFTNTLSDRIGRKWVVLSGLFVQAASGVLMSLIPGFITFVILRTIQGLSAKAVGYVSYVMCLEFLPIKIRTFYGIFYNFIWVLGYCLIGFMAYCLQDWRNLSLAFSIPLFFFIFHIWILPESPRFYMAANKPEKAKKILRRASKINKIELPANFELKTESSKADMIGNRLYTPIDLIRTPRVRRYFLLSSFLWFSNNLSYYMLSNESTTWGGNVYATFMMGGAIELPAYITSYMFGERFGRRINLMVGHTVLAFTCSLLGILNSYRESYDWLGPIVITLGVFSKYLSAFTFSFLLLIGTELFPTVLRGQAMGVCTLLGDFGTVISPVLLFLSGIYQPLPYIFVGCVSFFGAISVYFLAETWHRTLPVTVHDTEELHLMKPIEKMSLDEGVAVNGDSKA